MAREVEINQHGKISAEFTARLESLSPKQKVRAIVMLQSNRAGASSTRRQSGQERRKAITAVRRSVKTLLPKVDQILARFEGKRLAHRIDALGFVPVETTAEGINALADSEYVRVIFEDQPISPVANLR